MYETEQVSTSEYVCVRHKIVIVVPVSVECYIRTKERKVDIHKSAGVLIQDRKFLITRTAGKTIFIAPGGKVESGETPQAALIRELKEELGIDVDSAHLVLLGTFYAPAAGRENEYLQMDVFLVKAWDGVLAPASEVEEIRWISSEVTADIELGSIFHHDVLPLLKEQNLID